MLGGIDHYDGRAGMEAELKGDKRGLGLGLLRKSRLPAQQMVVLLTTLAHNVLIWSQRWLARGAPQLRASASCDSSRKSGACPDGSSWPMTSSSRCASVRSSPAWDVYRGLAQLGQPAQPLGFFG